MAEDGEKVDSVTAECPVCLTPHSLRDLLLTKCEHKFCKSCVAKLLKTYSCPLCRQRITVYDITRISTGRPLVERPTTITGAVYVQCNTVGLASYHFSEEESYISYSAAPPNWLLDDGSPPPVKKPFLQTNYDPTSRTFRAVVDWSDINFAGDAEWIYRMVFSEDFTMIERGEVLSYDADGEQGRWHVYQRDLHYKRLEQIDFEE